MSSFGESDKLFLIKLQKKKSLRASGKLIMWAILMAV